MKNTAFEPPVHILVGLGHPARIDGVADAYAMLNEWPPVTRTSDHDIALKVCRAALAGTIDADLARSTFVAFARRNNLLLEAPANLAAFGSESAFGQACPA